MAQLVKPNKNQHEYVVGIDFGHGETSAAICKVQWDLAAGRADLDAADIRINPSNTNNEKVIVSAISLTNDGKSLIGNDAFDSGQMERSSNIRVCFKEAPQDVNGKDEQLMVKYMRAVYDRIRDALPELTDDNHIVYIARPSGWQDEDVKERYREMALMAGIPLAGLTSESRAAIFYAKNSPNVGFAKEIEQGAIVFDLGSSTLDFTYLSKGDTPIDYGYRDCGASAIEQFIFEDNMAGDENVQTLLEHNPQYKARLLFEARKIKEEAYGKDASVEIDESMPMRKIIARDCSDYEALKNKLIIVEYENITALNNSIEKHIHYISSLKDVLVDFRDNHIPGKIINGVFLTGGASRMAFVADTIREVYQLDSSQVKVDPDNPSLTISRGIAMLGRADCISDVLVAQLGSRLKNVNADGAYNNLISSLSIRVGKDVWELVHAELLKFRNSSFDKSVDDLERDITNAIKNYTANTLQTLFVSETKDAIEKQTSQIRKELTMIINLYAPGEKLFSQNHAISVSTDEIENSLRSMSNSIINNIATQVTSNVSNIVSDVIWAAVGTFLFGIFYVGYKVLQFGWNRLTKTEFERKMEKRKEEAKRKQEAKHKKLDKAKREQCYENVMAESTVGEQQVINMVKKSLDTNSSTPQRRSSCSR